MQLKAFVSLAGLLTPSGESAHSVAFHVGSRDYSMSPRGVGQWKGATKAWAGMKSQHSG